MRSICAIASSVFLFLLVGVSQSFAQSEALEDWELSQLDHLIDQFDGYTELRAQQDSESNSSFIMSQQDDPFTPPPFDPGQLFPEDPVNRPIFGNPQNPYFPFPGTATRQGASYLVAMEILYQTLNFYGVTHYLDKKGSSIDFRILESKSGYFAQLTKLDVAFALREMSRYLSAHLCHNPSVENFYRAFGQVPAEKIGLRFKYDMAWALLGNYLPREPNKMFLLGKRWKALDQILNGSQILNSPDIEDQEIKRWASVLGEVMGLVGHLNRLMCFVDITPKTKDEFKKRVVVNKLLKMQRELVERYAQYKGVLDEMGAVTTEDQVLRLRSQDE